MDRILKSKDDLIAVIPYVRPEKWLEMPKVHYLVFNVFVVSFFAYAYVHWLWDAQKTAYTTFLVRSLLRSSLPLGFSILLLLSSISFVGFSYQVPDALMYYGLLLTIIWPVAVLFTLWKA